MKNRRPWRSWRSLAITFGMLLVLDACNQLVGIEDPIRRQASSSSGSNGGGESGGMGGSGGAGGTGGSGGSGGVSSSSSSGNGCSEMPCTVVLPQCGCDEPQMCYVDTEGKRSCIPEGTVMTNSLCSASSACVKGALCSRLDVNLSTCQQACFSDADCDVANASFCVRHFIQGNGVDLDALKLCSPACDLMTNAGCPGTETGCRDSRESNGAKRFFTLCDTVGMGQQGASCTQDRDCAGTFKCVPSNMGAAKMCAQYCVVGGAPCPSSLTCAPLISSLDSMKVEILGKEYGACR